MITLMIYYKPLSKIMDYKQENVVIQKYDLILYTKDIVTSHFPLPPTIDHDNYWWHSPFLAQNMFWGYGEPNQNIYLWYKEIYAAIQ